MIDKEKVVTTELEDEAQEILDSLGEEEETDKISLCEGE